MNELRSEIKSLMKSATDVPDKRDDSAPFGFAARVVAATHLAARRSVRQLHGAFSIASWTAVFVIIGCGVALVRQEQVAQPASQIAAAAQFFAQSISP